MHFLLFFTIFYTILLLELVGEHMNIHIVLTNYLLKFMYGDRAFQDPILLSREVLKKAYQEGLYFISPNKSIIDKIYEDKKFPNNNGFFFAGIPSITDVCLISSLCKEMYAIKLSLPYEELTSFSYTVVGGEKVLSEKVNNLKEEYFSKANLSLKVDNKTPLYIESGESCPLSYVDQVKVIDYFLSNVMEYKYMIESSLDALKERLNEIVLTNNLVNLEEVQTLYESLVVTSTSNIYKR